MIVDGLSHLVQFDAAAANERDGAGSGHWWMGLGQQVAVAAMVRLVIYDVEQQRATRSAADNRKNNNNSQRRRPSMAAAHKKGEVLTGSSREAEDRQGKNHQQSRQLGLCCVVSPAEISKGGGGWAFCAPCSNSRPSAHGASCGALASSRGVAFYGLREPGGGYLGHRAFLILKASRN